MTRFVPRLGLATIMVLTAFALASPPAAEAATGPYLVKDINTSGSSNPSELTDLDGMLMFAARGGGKGNELWRSDGTAVGTRRVKDINPGGPGSEPTFLTAVDGLLYFSASDGASGQEPWVSDGTSLGTRRIKDINPGAAASNPYGFTMFKGNVYFAARDAALCCQYELWRTDGTTAGTQRAKDLLLGSQVGDVGQLTAFAGRLFFTLSAGAINPMDTLYATDGTAAGTRPFRNRLGNVISGGGIGAQGIGGLTVIGSKMLFTRNESELWKTGGTTSTTRKIADVPVWALTPVGSTVFFESAADSGEQLWRSDGTAAGTVMVSLIDGNPRYMTDLSGRLVFFSYGMDGLWRSDGTEVELVYDILVGDGPAVLGSAMYFDGFTPDEWENCSCMGEPPQLLWRSDGSPGGTYPVAPQRAQMEHVTAVGDAIYFTSNANGLGSELWRYVP